MKSFNRYTDEMPESGIQKIFELSYGMEGVIHLEVGQPDFRTPEHILDAIARAGKEGFTKYTAAAGLAELREAIAAKVSDRNKFSVKSGNVVVSPGAVASIMSAMVAMAEPGDDILVPDPAWPNYIMQELCLGCRALRYPLRADTGFAPDFDALERLVTPKTKVLVINSPGNPTGAVFARETIERLVAFARKHDLFIISDEVYEEIVFDGEHVSAGQYNDDGRICTVFAFSKTYAVPGLRIGYSVSDEALAGVIEKLQTPLVTCPCSISQKACLTALDGPQDSVRMMRDVYRERRDMVIDILKRSDLWFYTPGGAFYLLIDISRTGIDSDDFALSLLKEKKVAVAPGATFGDTTRSFIRISFTTPTDDLVRGVEELCNFIH